MRLVMMEMEKDKRHCAVKMAQCFFIMKNKVDTLVREY